MSTLKSYEGGCHCGSVRFRVTSDFARVSDCNCSMCTKKGFVHLIVPLAQFELLSGKENLSTYTFNTGIAKHTFCKTCGIHAFYTPRSDPDKVDVNVRCLDNIDLATVSIAPFDGQNWEAAYAAKQHQA
jgi:hypothetical protein